LRAQFIMRVHLFQPLAQQLQGRIVRRRLEHPQLVMAVGAHRDRTTVRSRPWLSVVYLPSDTLRAEVNSANDSTRL
jgi:hypothetical protein